MSSLKRLLILGSKALIVIGAVAYLVISDKLQLAQLGIREEGTGWIISAALGLVGVYVLSLIRYWILLRAGGVPVGLFQVIRIGFISWFLNSTLLGGFGPLTGDAVRVGYLMSLSNRTAAILSATLIDRILGILGLIALAVFAIQIGWSETRPSPELRRLTAILYTTFAGTGLCILLGVTGLAKGRTWALVVWAVAGGISFIALQRVYPSPVLPAVISILPVGVAFVAPTLLPGGPLHTFIHEKLWLGDRIGAFVAALVEYRKNTAALVSGYGISLLISLATPFTLHFVAKGISLPETPSFRQICFAAPPANAIGAVPLPASGLGVGEAAFDAMLRLCAADDGSPVQGGASIFLAFRILNTLLGLIGLPFYLMTPRKAEGEIASRKPGSG